MNGVLLETQCPDLTLARRGKVRDVYDLGELETKPAYRTRIEAYMAIGIFNGKAAARLKGVLAG